MASSEPHHLAELVEAVLDAESSSSEDVALPPTTVRMHVQRALHAAQAPDVDTILAAILDDEGAVT